MSRILTNGFWTKTTKGWQYTYIDNNRKVTNLTTAQDSSTISIAWQCVIAYIKSPIDLRNLAATCRSLHQLVESELGWSYLIRKKFGQRLFLRHARQIFNPQNNQQINLHADIEMMGESKLLHKCATIPATFLLNRSKGYISPVARAILRSYRYHLDKEVSNCTIYIATFKNTFRQSVSFNNIHSEHLSDVQRQTVPLMKLIYFYLADQRRIPFVNFGIIYPRENVNEISDVKASTGRALHLSGSDKIIVLHPYHSIIPGKYEIFWRLRFTSAPIRGEHLEFMAVPQYGLMAREHTSSKQFADCLKKYDNNYFRQSMGTITVFKRCTVFVGCIDFTQWQPRTTFALDYIEMIAVV